MQTLLPQAAARDDRAYDLSARGVMRTGMRLLALLAALMEAPFTPTDAPGAERPRRAWGRALDLPDEAPLTLFVLGRMVEWTGHLIEQYERDRVIRPCAQYVGPPPTEASS